MENFSPGNNAISQTKFRARRIAYGSLDLGTYGSSAIIYASASALRNVRSQTRIFFVELLFESPNRTSFIFIFIMYPAYVQAGHYKIYVRILWSYYGRISRIGATSNFRIAIARLNTRVARTHVVYGSIRPSAASRRSLFLLIPSFSFSRRSEKRNWEKQLSPVVPIYHE